MKVTTLPTRLLIILILLSSCGSSTKMINCYSFSNGKTQKNHFLKLDYRHKKIKKKKKKNKNQKDNLLIDIEKELNLNKSTVHSPTKAISPLTAKGSNFLTSTSYEHLPFSESNKSISKTHKKRKKKGSKPYQKPRIVANIEFYKSDNVQRGSRFVTGKDNLFLFYSGMIGVLMAGLFWFNRLKLQRISLWATKNNKKAIFLIGSIKTSLMLSGLFIGRQLAENELAFSDSTRNILIGSYIAAALFYPVKNSLNRFFKPSNFRQKINDFALVLSGFLIMICLGNKSTVDPNYSSPNNFVFQTYDNFSVETLDDSKVFKDNTDHISLSKNSINSSKKNQLSTGTKVGLTILAIVIFLFLMGLVSYLACSLSCNGQEALALIVGVGGISGLVTGLVFVMRSIYKKN